MPSDQGFSGNSSLYNAPNSACDRFTDDVGSYLALGGITESYHHENWSPSSNLNVNILSPNALLVRSTSNPHICVQSPKASKISNRSNLFLKAENAAHITIRPENRFNNTDPHTVHTDQSNAMPNHGRNVHEEHLASVARYIPYPSTIELEANQYKPNYYLMAQPQQRHDILDDLPEPRTHFSAFSSASESAASCMDTVQYNQVSSLAHQNSLYFRHDPYATQHILRASCMPFERVKYAKADLQAVISAVCGNDFNAIVDSVQNAATGHCLEVKVRTSQPKVLANKMAEAVILMDRRGFFLAHHIEPQCNNLNQTVFSTRQAVLDYCEHVRNLPQQERHWRLDGLPCSTAGFRMDGFETKHGNNRGDKNYRQAHLARNQRRSYLNKAHK